MVFVVSGFICLVFVISEALQLHQKCCNNDNRLQDGRPNSNCIWSLENKVMKMMY